MGIFDFLRNKKSSKASEPSIESTIVKQNEDVKSFLASVASLNNPKIGINFLSALEAFKYAESYKQIEAFQS